MAQRKTKRLTGTEELTLEEIFQELQQGRQATLSNTERTFLKAHLQKLYKDGKVSYRRGAKGFTYHVKRRKE